MKNTRIVILIVFTILFGCHLSAKAQSYGLHAVVTMLDGQEQGYYLSEEDLFSFVGQETLVISTQGSTVQLNLDDIRKIEFVDVTGTQEIQAGVPYFYPNPVKNSILIGNIENGQTVSILSLEGRLIRQFQASANEVIDLSALPAGVYFLNINHQNHKLLKL